MPSWKKVIVSGSQAHLSGITSSVLANDNLLIAGNVGQIENSGLTYNGTTLAIGGASITSTGANSVLTGSFAGTFSGSLSVDLQNLTQGTGITAFTYDGNSPATVAVSGASALSTNRVTKWTGAAFADTTITDNGSIITTTTPLSVGGAITASAVSASGIISASTLFTPGFVYANTVFPVGSNPVLGDNTSTTEAGRWDIEGKTIELVSNTADWPLIIYTGSVGLGNEIFKIRRDTRRVAINLSNALPLNFGLQVEDTFFARASTISQSLTVIGPISASGNISGSSLFITGDTSVGGNVTLGDASGDAVTVNAQTLTLANQLAVGALSSTMLVITSSNRVATQTLGAGVATFLNTPSSANLAAAVTDETGTGTLVFSASPTFTGTVNAANITATGNLIVTGSTILGDASDKPLTIRGQSVTLSNPLASTANVNNILVLTSSNRIATQSIDSRVWGTTLVDNNGTSFTATRVPFATDGNSLIDSDRLTFNNSTNVLSVNTSTFGLDVNVVQNLSVAGNTTLQGNLIVTGSTTLGDASGDAVTVNAQTLTLANQLAVGALSSTMLVITSSNRVATQTLGAGVATFLNTPSSANLAAAVTDETGTGTLVFSASPTFTGTVNAANITATGNLIVSGSTTLGDASGDSVTINAATIGIANVGAGTTDTVLIRDGSNTIKTRTIDTRVWGSTLIDGSLTANRVPFASDANTITDDSNFTYNSGTDVLTVNGSTFGQDVVVSGNLTVNGTTTILNVDNLLVEDKFILLASGSTSPTDGGIIVQTTTGSANVASGSAFYLETGGSTQRWALAQNVPQNATAVTPTDYMVSAQTAAGNPSSNPTYGGSSVGFGNIYVNSSDESIWIFS